MSRGLGPNQKKIIKYCFMEYNKRCNEDPDFWEYGNEQWVWISYVDILERFYHVPLEKVCEIPFNKKDNIYKSIRKLKKRGWIRILDKKSKIFKNAPVIRKVTTQTTYKTFEALIKVDKIFNFKTKKWTHSADIL